MGKDDRTYINLSFLFMVVFFLVFWFKDVKELFKEQLPIPSLGSYGLNDLFSVSGLS